MSESNESGQSTGPIPRQRLWLRIVAALALVAAILAIAILFKDDLTLGNLARHETRLRRLQAEHAGLAYLLALLVYVAVTGLSIPAATGLSLLYGWCLGFWQGVLVVSFGSTAGATLAFLTSRYLLREAVQQRYGDRLTRFNAELEREGAYYLFTLRLLPVVPFFVVNAVMGLTPIRVRTFWWVSQLGMLPATLIYVYAGSISPDLRTLADRGVAGLPVVKIAIALTMLALLPWGARALSRRISRRSWKG
jgi:uncharacterized membrane protein YdjX (TVP38/TMEM64 family)